VVAVGVLAVGGCGEEGQVSIRNDAESDVDVRLSDTDVEEDVPGFGGVVIYTDECFAGPIVVTYPGGRTAEVAQSICPGQELVIRDEGAELHDATSSS
jgi:hypothetical protein